MKGTSHEKKSLIIGCIVLALVIAAGAVGIPLPPGRYRVRFSFGVARKHIRFEPPILHAEFEIV